MKPLSPSELEVMKVIWQHGALSVREMLTHVNQRRKQPVTRTTVLKQVQRLEENGYLRRDDSRPALYSPLVTEEDGTRELTREFTRSVFDGSPLKMIRSFFNDKKLNPNEVAELKDLLRKLDNND